MNYFHIKPKKKKRFERVIPHWDLLDSLSKRQKFALQTLILSGGLLLTQLVWEDYRFYMVGLLAVASYILTAWSLAEDIRGAEWLLLFILPVVFTASVSLFYYLLPARWIIRLTIATVFAIGTYAYLLVENIYNVAAERSIQLLRAAQSIGLLITLIVMFLLTSIVFSFRMSFWANMLILSPFAGLLSLQSIWSVNLESKLTNEVISYSVIIGILVGELAMAISFWPIQISTVSLLVASGFYAMVGILQQKIQDRLFVNTVREYIFAFIFTFLVAFVTTAWG